LHNDDTTAKSNILQLIHWAREFESADKDSMRNMQEEHKD